MEINKNSDILFLYDAKMTNPNGNPDDENRPRMDYETGTNLISDVRLKRFIRDYLQQYLGYEIFVGKQEGKTVTATDRIKNVLGTKTIGTLDKEEISHLLDKLIDVRLFGATMPIKIEGSKGSSTTFTGPVQFNWGYSLNKTRIVDASGITSHFSSESSMEQGTMGRDFRVYYSLIAFHGIVSAMRASKTHMTQEDLKIFDEAIIKSIPLMATRSKIGQYPRLYLRVEYVDNSTLLGDLRYGLTLPEDNGNLRDIRDVRLDVSKLYQQLVENKEKIEKVYLWSSDQLQLEGFEETSLSQALQKEGLLVENLMV